MQAYLGQQAKINDDLQKVTGKPDSNTISAPPPGVDSQDLDGLRAKLVSVKLQIADLDKIKDKNTEQLTQLRTLRRQRTEIEKAIRELGGSTATGPSKSSVNDAATQAEQDRKSAYEINQRKIKEAIAAQKTIAEESTPDSTRPLEARQKQFEKEKELINATKDFELGAKKLSAVERQNIIDDAAQKERDAEQSLADDRVKIQLNADARQLADREKFIKALSNSKKKEVDALTDNFEDRNGVARRRADERLKNLNDEYAADKITKAQYEKEKEQIEAAYLKSSLLNEIDYYEALANLYDDDSKEHKAALNKIADLRKKASEIPINAKTDGKTKKDEEFDDEHAAKKVKEKLIQLGEELKDTFFSIIDSGFEKQKVALDEQIDLIQKRKEAELKANDQTAASAQDKAAQASLIESRAAAQTAALERAKRKIDVERAKFDRARALTQVAQEAAVGIIAAQEVRPAF